MSSILLDLINSTHPNWESIRKRIGTHPSEIHSHHKKTNQSPLLAIVGHSSHHVPPPSDIISTLVRSSSSSSSKKLKDSDKLEILTVACYNSNMNGEIILILLEAFELNPSMEFVYRLIKDILSFQRGGDEDEDEVENDVNGNDDENHDDGEAEETSSGIIITTTTTTTNNNNTQSNSLNDDPTNRISGEVDDVDFDSSTCNIDPQKVNRSKQPLCTISALIQYWPNVLNTVDKNGNILLHHICGKGKIPINLLINVLETSIQIELNGGKNENERDEKKEEEEDIYYHHNHHHNCGGLLKLNRYMKTPLHNLCRIINDDNSEKAIEKIRLCREILAPLLKLPILHCAITSVTKSNYFTILVNALKNTKKKEQKNKGFQNSNNDYDITTSVLDQWNRTLIQVAIDSVLSNTNRNARELLNLLVHSSIDNDIVDRCDCYEDHSIVASYRDKLCNRLPIHYACELGLPWANGLEDIVVAYPSALEVVDDVTSLFPFMLAACTSSSSSSCVSFCTGMSTKEEHYDLNAIYRLLQRNPIVIEMSRCYQ